VEEAERPAGPFPVKRLEELREQFDLPVAATEKLALLVELVAGDPEAPTSITDPGKVIDAHLADSLSALPLIVPLIVPSIDRSQHAIADIGSGAGFPGLPLAIALEHADVDLIEATGRKCRFIEHVIERLDQRSARAICARAEDWARGDGAERYDLALARAVGRLATLIEYASPLLREHGLLLAWKGARDEGEERQGAAAAWELGMSLREVRRVIPFPGARSRHLHVFEKVGPTPEGVPRRAGMARKRPFGS
jgi:16S rRNA (guanine527-N7)-methyltransferase